MIKVLREGSYTLFETKNQTKMLVLDNERAFAWINAEGIGEILVVSQVDHQTDALLATGRYRIYEIMGEPDFTDLQHLELQVGNRQWQGYLLPTGLPNQSDKRNRVIPTNELITKAYS